MEDLVESHARFDIETQREEMLDYLDQHGYAVIKGVAKDVEIEEGINLLWDFMLQLPSNKCDRNDPSTWNDDEWYPSPRNGILNAMGTGQSAIAWQARLFPKVKETFASIWGTDDLITSFDGVNVFRPWKKEKSWRTKGSWWHVDQNAYHEDKRGRVCVQGFVSYTPANSISGGLCVLAGSHKYHTEMCLRNELAYLEGDFLKVSAEDEVFQKPECEKRLVCCEAGDLVIWDSRTTHCNSPGKESEAHKQDPSSLLRVCAYVCMTPRCWASDDVLQARRLGFIHNESTTHWPHLYCSSGRASSDYLPKNTINVVDDDEAYRSCGISLQQRLLIDGNIEAPSYWSQAYAVVESTFGSMCNIC